jgi:hypothetical protein
MPRMEFAQAFNCQTRQDLVVVVRAEDLITSKWRPEPLVLPKPDRGNDAAGATILVPEIEWRADGGRGGRSRPRIIGRMRTDLSPEEHKLVFDAFVSNMAAVVVQRYRKRTARQATGEQSS